MGSRDKVLEPTTSMNMVLTQNPRFILLLLCFLLSQVSSNPLLGSSDRLQEVEKIESNPLPDLLDEYTPKVRVKRFILPDILNIGNLVVVQLLGTAIRPTNFILLKVNVSVKEEERRKRKNTLRP